MGENIENLIPHLLMKIQEDMAAFRQSVEARFTCLEQKFDRLEEINRKQRRDSAGMLVMMRATAGDFDARVRDVEKRMDAFDKAKN